MTHICTSDGSFSQSLIFVLKLPGIKRCTDLQFQNRFLFKFLTLVGMYTGLFGCEAVYYGSCAQIILKNLFFPFLGYFCSLKIQEIASSETSVCVYCTWRNFQKALMYGTTQNRVISKRVSSRYCKLSHALLFALCSFIVLPNSPQRGV